MPTDSSPGRGPGGHSETPGHRELPCHPHPVPCSSVRAAGSRQHPRPMVVTSVQGPGTSGWGQGRPCAEMAPRDLARPGSSPASSLLSACSWNILLLCRPLWKHPRDPVCLSHLGEAPLSPWSLCSAFTLWLQTKGPQRFFPPNSSPVFFKARFCTSSSRAPLILPSASLYFSRAAFISLFSPADSRGCFHLPSILFIHPVCIHL